MEGERPTIEGLLGRWLNLKDRQVRAILYILVLGLAGMWIVQFDRFVGAGRMRPGPPGTLVTGPAAGPADVTASELRRQETLLAQDLEHVLSAVSGAGEVRVQVTLASGPERVPATESRQGTRTIEEQDADGGRRKTTDQNQEIRPVMAGAGGGSEPWVQETRGAEVAGVLVVAEGARSARVRYELQRAVEVALGISPNRVVVMPMGDGRTGGGRR